MGNKTINPVIMVGTYIGLVAGFLCSLKGWYIFWWLPALFGVNQGTPMILNAIGGMIAGYIIQILIKILNFHSPGAAAKKEMKERNIRTKF